MLNGVLALSAHGYRTDSEPLRLGLEAIDRFTLQDASGIRIEACQSPVWDTTLMMIGLLDSGAAEERLKAPRQWITRLQILEDHGDWKVYNPQGKPGGWSFEYANTWYPDVDDTAAVVIAFVKQEPASARSNIVRRALDWVVSMQNEDGGWAAFDKANDKLFLNEIPFADMGALCDPSTPDIAGRVLEALGLVSDPRYEQACERGIRLPAEQETRKTLRAVGLGAGASITWQRRTQECAVRAPPSRSPLRRPDDCACTHLAPVGAERRWRVGGERRFLRGPQLHGPRALDGFADGLGVDGAARLLPSRAPSRAARGRMAAFATDGRGLLD